jgi:two-component system, sensor histidine kinase and response regulator
MRATSAAANRPALGDPLVRGADEILRQARARIFQRTDRVFAALMAVQWGAAVILATVLSPSTWNGSQASLHPHVVSAVFLGGVITALPVLLALRYPGRAVTRHTIVIAQCAFSALLIQVTGGRIETHFHIFGSLAFIAAYRDWKVFIPATAFIAADHLIRGVFWPQTVFGVATASPWRAAEHAGWVLFEVVFLILLIRQSVQDIRVRALQTADLIESHDELRIFSEELRQSAEKERAIIEGALDAVVQMNSHGLITGWNGQAERTFGWTAAEAIGQSVSDMIVPEKYRAAHLQGLRRFQETGHVSVVNQRLELEGVRRDGQTFPLEIAISSIGVGSEMHFCAFVRDITERTRREEALRNAMQQAKAANRTKSAFLANMSHEIRTPLNGILGFTELLIRDGDNLDEPERRDYVRTIRNSGKLLLQLINDILDLSKIEAGQMVLEITDCPPHQLIAEVVSVLRARAREKGINLEYRWDSAIPESIKTDPYRLRQLLMNLVGNAVKFTDQGSVTIVSRLVSDGNEPHLVMEVHDTGIGIATAHLQDIFKPFVQADNSVTRQYGGTGLGLAICKSICDALGGTLVVASTPGQGSTFTATIPTGDLEGVVLSQFAPSSPAGDIIDTREGVANLAGVRILLADDGETNRKLIQLFLSRQGAQVQPVENGELAVAAARHQSFDVILMDMQMPVVDGYEATRQLRAAGYVAPIVALTAHAMAGDRKKCEDAGCSGYVSKPVNVDELVQVILGATRSHGAALPSKGTQMTNDWQSRPADASPIHSTLPTDDDEIRELVAEFAEGVSERIESLQAALQSLDFDAIASMAHALKGAGGTAGFTCLTEVSARMERLAHDGHAAAVEGTINELQALNDRLVV